MTRESEPIITGAPTSPMETRGRSVLANPLPRICSSPPAIAAGGVTCEICGLESDAFRRGIFANKDCSAPFRDNPPTRSDQIPPSCQPQHQSGIQSGHHVVRIDSPAAGERFQLTGGGRLPDIEQAEEDERGKVGLPGQDGGAGEGDPLPDYFVHYDNP